MEKPVETTTPTRAKNSIIRRALIFWPFVSLLLYVLSYGPVLKYLDGQGMVEGFASKFYYPVYWAYSDTPLHKPLGMYFHLWDDHYDGNGDGRFY
jgi:hypothetical protein